MPKGVYFMNTYQQLKRLGEIIAELTALYGELSEELPRLEFVGAHTPANSELKKMTRRLSRSGRRREVNASKKMTRIAAAF